MYKLYTDGSALVRFALGGIGGYILDSEGNEVVSFSEVIYNQIKNHESQALLCGLKIAKDMGITHIQCYSDAKSLEDVFKPKNEKKQGLYTKHNDSLKEAFEISKEFKFFKCTYIPREENKKADNLSRIALVKKRQASILKKSEKQNKNPQPYIHVGLKTINEFNRIEFSKLSQTIKNHFVFEKKKSKDETNINVYLVSFSTDSDYTVKKLNTFLYTEEFKETNSFMLNCIIQTLKENTALKNVTLSISGTLIGKILTDNIKAYKKQFDELNQVVNQYENVCLYTRPLVRQLIANNMKKPDINTLLDIANKEVLFQALSIVTQKDYNIEENDIYTTTANYYTNNQFQTLENIEKYYFYQLVRLNVNQIKKETQMVKVNKDEIIDNIKEELKQKNIHISIK